MIINKILIKLLQIIVYSIGEKRYFSEKNIQKYNSKICQGIKIY